jgi:hypothetical protein
MTTNKMLWYLSLCFDLHFRYCTCTLQLQLRKRCKRVIVVVVVAGESVFLCYLKFDSSMSPDKTWGKSLFYWKLNVKYSNCLLLAFLINIISCTKPTKCTYNIHTSHQHISAPLCYRQEFLHEALKLSSVRYITCCIHKYYGLRM